MRRPRACRERAVGRRPGRGGDKPRAPGARGPGGGGRGGLAALGSGWEPPHCAGCQRLWHPPEGELLGGAAQAICRLCPRVPPDTLRSRVTPTGSPPWAASGLDRSRRHVGPGGAGSGRRMRRARGLSAGAGWRGWFWGALLLASGPLPPWAVALLFSWGGWVGWLVGWLVCFPSPPPVSPSVLFLPPNPAPFTRLV